RVLLALAILGRAVRVVVAAPDLIPLVALLLDRGPVFLAERAVLGVRLVQLFDQSRTAGSDIARGLACRDDVIDAIGGQLEGDIVVLNLAITLGLRCLLRLRGLPGGLRCLVLGLADR